MAVKGNENDAQLTAVLQKAFALYDAEQKESLFVVDKQRYEEMKIALELVEELALNSDEESKIELKVGEVDKTDAYIEVTADSFGAPTMRMETLYEIISLADNFEVMPFHSKIKVSFGFFSVLERKSKIK